MNKPKANELGLETKAGALSPSPERLAHEAAQLKAMVDGMNREFGVLPEPEAIEAVLTTGSARISPPLPSSKTNTQRIYLTGRLKSGKDFLAAQMGAEIFSLASPLYRMREVLFGEGLDKDKWGAREFLQTAGQHGRGEISAKHPITPARACFSQMVRALGSRGDFGFPEVDWKSFGVNSAIWLDALLRRVDNFVECNPGRRVVVTNCRFANEVKALEVLGWTGWHVCCSIPTWEARIKAAGLDPQSPALRDESEALAISLDKQAQQAARQNPSRKVRAVWNDPQQAPPSAAYHTPESFLVALV